MNDDMFHSVKVGDYTLHIDDRSVVVSIYREASPSGILANGAEECTKWFEAIREEMGGRARIVWNEDENRYVVRKRDDTINVIVSSPDRPREIRGME